MNAKGQSELLLRQTLQDYSHLDISHYIVAETVVQKGGGGCSDVFQSKLSSSWQPRADSDTIRLYELEISHLNPARKPGDSKLVESSSCGPRTSVTFDGLTVAVKRLRFWSKPDQRIEKVNTFASKLP